MHFLKRKRVLLRPGMLIPPLLSSFTGVPLLWIYVVFRLVGVHRVTMKVHKVSSRSQHEQRNATKRHSKNKWHKNIRRLDSTLLNTSSTTKLDQQIAKREKPTVKRLKKSYVKPVTFIPENSCAKEGKVEATSVTFPHVHTNGGTGLDDSSSASVDSQEWSEYANSVLQNGMESTTLTDSDQRTEDDLQFHAHLDHTHNRAVLVMKQDQVDLEPL